MNNKSQSFGSRSYEDFQAPTEWISDNISDTLLIRLPGFSKEHLKVQMDNFGNLRAIGERPLDAGGLRWSRFQTEHPIPSSCDVRGVRARFDNNILYISFPKAITEEQKPTVPPTPTPTPKPAPEPTPEPQKERPPTPEPEPEKERPPTPEPEPEKERPPMPEQKKEPERKKEEEEEVKEKEENEERDVGRGERETNGGGAAAPAPAPEKMRIGFWARQPVVNMLVAVILIVVIGIYVGYELSGGWGVKRE